nr:MAG TPA: hypothetical protein [Caudoviricetes sp.]
MNRKNGSKPVLALMLKRIGIKSKKISFIII